MLPFAASLFFMLLLGKKIRVANSALLILAILLAVCHFLIGINTVPVLVTLFIAAPFLIRFRYSVADRLVFFQCVLLALLITFYLQGN